MCHINMVELRIDISMWYFRIQNKYEMLLLIIYYINVHIHLYTWMQALAFANIK